MSKRHLVRAGESIISLAFENGFYPGTLWNHTENSRLRQERQVGTVLKEGDSVYIPDLEVKEVSKDTDTTHVFRRKGFPEKLRIRFLNSENKPRAGCRYLLTVDGTVLEGVTDSEGFLSEAVPPNAVTGRLVLFENGAEENFEIRLSHLQPITELSGLQARLTQLGYQCQGEETFGPLTRRALLAFQKDYHLAPTGESDEATRLALRQIYGA